MLSNIFDDAPSIRIFDFLLENKDYDYSITEISKNTHTSRSSVYKIVENLEYNKIVRRTRTMGNSNLYQIENNEAINLFESAILIHGGILRRE